MAMEEQKDLNDNETQEQTNLINDNDDQIAKSKLKIISVYLEVDRIKSIDLVNQKFAAQGRIIFGLEATKDDYDKYNDDPKGYISSTESRIHGLFRWHNGDVNMQELYRSVVKVGDKDEVGGIIEGTVFPYTYYDVFAYDGEFNEIFELENFPFDAQDLQIRLECTASTDAVIFYPHHPAGPPAWFNWGMQIYNSVKQDVPEYDMGDAFFTNFEDKRSKNYSSVNYQLKLIRKYKVYFWKIIMVLFITTACSFLAFTMDLDESVSDIYGLGITLLLTATAFQFVISSTLPNLPYLTLLDIYVISCFVIIFGVILIVAICNISDSINDNEFTIVGIVSFIIFFIIQSVFCIKFFYARKYEEKKMKMNYLDGQREELLNNADDKPKDAGGKGPEYGVLEANYFLERFKNYGLNCEIPVDDMKIQ